MENEKASIEDLTDNPGAANWNRSVAPTADHWHTATPALNGRLVVRWHRALWGCCVRDIRFYSNDWSEIFRAKRFVIGSSAALVTDRSGASTALHRLVHWHVCHVLSPPTIDPVPIMGYDRASDTCLSPGGPSRSRGSAPFFLPDRVYHPHGRGRDEILFILPTRALGSSSLRLRLI